jgi:beta-glucosidase
VSYAAFEYSDLTIVSGTTSSDTLVEVTITNISDVAGEDLVQIYCRDDVASVARPNRELIAS